MSARATRRAIMVIVLLQVVVLLVMPLLAGPRLPSGMTVHLRAVAGEHPDLGPDFPSEELWLDYGFDDVEPPRSARVGDTVYVELRGGSGARDPKTLGRAVLDPEELGDDAVWIKLWLERAGRLDAGPITVYSDPDERRVASLRSHLDDDGALDVVVALDNDGDPTIEDVDAVE